MYKTLQGLIGFAVLLSGWTIAQAAPTFYVGANIGGAYYDLDHDDSDQVLFDKFTAMGTTGVIYDTYLDRSAGAAAALVGVRLGPNFAFEASYMDVAYAEFGARALQQIGGGFYAPVKLRGRIETHGPTLSALAIYPWKAWDFYARAGVLDAKTELHFRTRGTGYHVAGESDTNTAFILGSGAGLHFTRHLTARAEWQYIGNVGRLNTFGNLDLSLFNVGVVYEF